MAERPNSVALAVDGAVRNRVLYVRLELIFFNGAVEGLTAALYAVLELSIPLWKLRNDLVWASRSLPRWKTLAEAHHVSGNEAMRRGFLLVKFFHCGAFWCATAEARRCTSVEWSPLACD